MTGIEQRGDATPFLPRRRSLSALREAAAGCRGCAPCGGACFPWLREELALVRPDVLVILGATAGKALLGSSFRLESAPSGPVRARAGVGGESALSGPVGVRAGEDRESASSGSVKARAGA